MPNASEQWEGTQRTEQPDEGRVGRRLFIGAMTAAVAGMAKTVIANEKPAMDLQTYVKNFPIAKEIEGIARTHRYFADNPKRVLVHLRMSHDAPNLTNDEAGEVMACQRNLRKAIECLIEDPRVKLDHLYSEGMTTNETALGILQNNPFLPQEETARDTYLMRHWGVDAVLYETHNLLMKPAETIRAQTLANSARTTSEYERYVQENRENVLLRLIHNRGDTIAFTLYGAAHNWENNIKKWNERNPHEQFSYIELLPKGIEHTDNRNYAQYEKFRPLEPRAPSIAAK